MNLRLDMLTSCCCRAPVLLSSMQLVAVMVAILDSLCENESGNENVYEVLMAVVGTARSMGTR